MKFHSTERFTDQTEYYAQARPRYPQSVVDLLVAETGLTPRDVIADIGSGTGLVAELFLRNGNTVFGVEPNAEMRKAGEIYLRQFSNFLSIAGTAEETGLGDSVVDYLTAGQAFHWFDLELAGKEFRRILRGDGWVVLLWNSRRTDGSTFQQGYEKLLRKYCKDYLQVRQLGEHLLGERKSDLRGTPIAAFFNEHVTRRILANEQHLDLTGLRKRLLSSSYVPRQDDPAFVPMLRDLERLFNGHELNGEVVMDYDLEIYLGRLE
jgi:SAM-dependent methyltransferase